MIRFDHLEAHKDDYRLQFLLARPFPHLAIDGLCEDDKLHALLAGLPELHTKSRDYVFAANKFEKSKFRDLSPLFTELYNDLCSERFGAFLQYISNEPVFVDKAFHGGGIHQGKKGSFLDMHIDFNYHPLHSNWYRTLNLLLYLNNDWKEEYGGQLKLEDLRTGEKKSIGIPFNRLVIQLTNRYTLHGYDRTSFPEGQHRTSIAGYAYMIHQRTIERPRTTDWHVGDDEPLKKLLARLYDPAVKIKNKLFGSATAKH
ncbi:2OG-Fe(II) oxygenase [Flaviaesturariibacter amylovorans]|uniref:Prolyl 4-hydroxylase alpha subunit Fe(2+) 2OG dioxygenase domain-containing protein n=1 Tax=Flaviaesturariibacter amylovorans TaxID=1084520 RepID=A0ABP8HF35_9BACT